MDVIDKLRAQPDTPDFVQRGHWIDKRLRPICIKLPPWCNAQYALYLYSGGGYGCFILESFIKIDCSFPHMARNSRKGDTPFRTTATAEDY